MFFYIVCALFLLNAFTTEAQPECGTLRYTNWIAAQGMSFKELPCEDQGGEMFCLGPKNAGQCNSPGFAKIAEQFCAKTCGLC
ncbi:shTK domain protein [Ostertagia ostertagi]